MIGQTVGHFRIIEKAGEGGMGVVYRAHDTRLGRTVAIKVIRAEALGDPERKRRFVQEARTASALNHPNIVTIYEIAADGDVDFIAMEFVDGQPLDRLAARTPLTIDQILDYGIQIAGALGAAHAAGVVHRDIKPGNIIVTPTGQVKVLDFGLAKLAEWRAVDEATATVYAAARTADGIVVGTMAYMSPEQAEAKPIDARSDVFSLGAVLYELLTGTRPFHGETPLSTLAAVIHGTPAPVSDRRRDAPDALARIVTRCLEKDRAARYRSGEDVAVALRECRQAIADSRGGRLARALRSPVALAAGVAAIAAMAAALWWTLGADGTRGKQRALSDVAALIEKEQFSDALRVARKAGLHHTEDPQTRQLLRRISITSTIRTEPEGADVYIKDYLSRLTRSGSSSERSPISEHAPPVQPAALEDRQARVGNRRRRRVLPRRTALCPRASPAPARPAWWWCREVASGSAARS